MNEYGKEELKRLISECLRERPDSYLIQQLFEQFPTMVKLMDVSEQQLMTIRGIGIGKAPSTYGNVKWWIYKVVKLVDMLYLSYK